MLKYPISQFLMKIKITIITIDFSKNVHINNINMLYYKRTDVSKGIGVNKTNESKHNCHYWQFLDKGFKF